MSQQFENNPDSSRLALAYEIFELYYFDIINIYLLAWIIHFKFIFDFELNSYAVYHAFQAMQPSREIKHGLPTKKIAEKKCSNYFTAQSIEYV